MKKNILPNYLDIKRKLPLLGKEKEFLKYSRKLTKNIFSQKIKKFIIFTGPCSIHDEMSTLEYAKKLALLQKKLKNIHLIMRVFFEKPRSKHSWKGFLYDPDLKNPFDLEKGIIRVRKLLLKLSSLNIPISCELYDPNTFGFFEDLITWTFVGARTSASSFHRHFASSLKIPVGFKNALDGDIDIAIDGAIVGRKAQSFVSINELGMINHIISDGNKYSHVVLRGSKNKINYDKNSIKNIIKKIEQEKTFIPLIIDCSHGNSQNNYANQITAFKYILKNLIQDFPSIIGLMLESNIEEGNQKLDPLNLRFGLSITDPCINFEMTKGLILNAERYFNKAEHLL